MQGNDIGTEYGKKFVVVLEPLLCYTAGASPKQLKARMHLTRTKRQEADAETYILNYKMLSWINWYCRSFSVHCTIWSFLPEPTFDKLSLPVAKVVGNYITEWTQFDDISLAYHSLRNDPDILSVYDGDLDRVQEFWHFRGVHIEIGNTP